MPFIFACFADAADAVTLIFAAAFIAAISISMSPMIRLLSAFVISLHIAFDDFLVYFS